MLKDKLYSPYSTPFKFKDKTESKVITRNPVKGYTPPRNTIFDSPYNVKNAKAKKPAMANIR